MNDMQTCNMDETNTGWVTEADYGALKRQLEAENRELYCLIDELRDYLFHDSHRCFTTKSCHCGLNALLEEHGLAKVDRQSSGLGETAGA